MKLRKQGHCAYKCEYHLVIVSKYRRKILNDGAFSYFSELMKGVIHDGFPEVEVLESNHDLDHIHMLISIPPKMKVCDVVRRIKSTTGRLMKRKFEYMRKAYWGVEGIWSDGYFVSTVKTIIEKVNRISDNLISINTQEKILNDQTVNPRVLSGSMMTISKDVQSIVNLRVSSESGICIIGQNSDCLVSESTRKPGQIFEVVQVDGLNLNVRYSGSDVRLEKFSILPESSDEFLPDTNWNVEVIKDDEISRMYYKVTYKTLQ